MHPRSRALAAAEEELEEKLRAPQVVARCGICSSTYTRDRWDMLVFVGRSEREEIRLCECLQGAVAMTRDDVDDVSF